ncbi:meiotic nuclear division protein 1 homolog [Phaethornis superciliosus]
MAGSGAVGRGRSRSVPSLRPLRESGGSCLPACSHCGSRSDARSPAPRCRAARFHPVLGLRCCRAPLFWSGFGKSRVNPPGTWNCSWRWARCLLRAAGSLTQGMGKWGMGGRSHAGTPSKKKGLSFEEKRARMMEIFFETKDVFQLKDIEKIAPKEKGITSMSVKEILQSLVDDGMVDTDRIGTSNYFWAFPSKALHARKRKLEELESQVAESSQKKEALQKSIEKSKIGREDTKERTALIKELAALQHKKEQLKAEIDKYRECDPDVVEEMRQTNKIAKEAANRWTDNIFSIKSWAKRKFGFEESRIDKSFGIPEDLDYID